MIRPIYTDRPEGESRQDTVERLRRCLTVANQEYLTDEECRQTTIINVDNPNGGWTKFTFVGNPSKAHIRKTVKETYHWQEELSTRYEGKKIPSVGLSNHRTIVPKSKHPTRGPDIVISNQSTEAYQNRG